MRTQSVIVRLPADLVENVDRLVEKEIFPSRANFVLSAVLNRFPALLQSMPSKVWSLVALDVPVRGKVLKEQIQQEFNDEKIFYLGFGGDPVRINVRVPNGIMTLWENLCNSAEGLFPFQDLARYCCTYYIGLWSDALRGEIDINNFMKTVLPEKEQESLRKTMRGEYFTCSPDSSKK